jgi:hypothetical protein
MRARVGYMSERTMSTVEISVVPETSASEAEA